MILYINYYLFALGILLLILSLAEFLFPYKIFNLWQKAVNSKIFYLYGLILIIGAFPLCYKQKGVVGLLIFIAGIILVLSGPFILLYGTKFRELFFSEVKELKVVQTKEMVYAESVTHLILGFLLVYQGFKVIFAG